MQVLVVHNLLNKLRIS